MDVEQYLSRIKYSDSIIPSPEVLATLQKCHLLHVPFENLDIHYEKKINLSNLFDKIVTRNRGGFCYELNGLFYELLKAIGYRVKMVSARVFEGNETYSPEYDHMALVVTCDEESYLTDVGFGEFSFYPLKIGLDSNIRDPRGDFRIERFDDEYKVVLKMDKNGIFKPEYLFSETERRIDEFSDRCNYHQTSPESHFKQKRICSLPSEHGRTTLTGDLLKITLNDEVTERELKNELEFQKELKNLFGIKL